MDLTVNCAAHFIIRYYTVALLMNAEYTSEDAYTAVFLNDPLAASL